MYGFLTRLLPMASAAFLCVSPLLAAAPDDGSTPPNVAAWVKAVNAKVDRAMVQPPGAHDLVIATFRRAEDGRAADVRVMKANPALQRAARATLNRLRNLPPMPRGVDPRQRIRAQLLFGGALDADAYRVRRETLLAAADAENRRVSGTPAIELAANAR